MEPAEIHFRAVDRAVARENFLEKEMLDSDVHHLEVQGQFFDKLAVLSAGSLAVGISFIVSGFEHPSVQVALHQHLGGVTCALSLLFLSLIACIIHNFRVTSAVHLLSRQLENVYKGANILRRFRESNPQVPLTKSDPEHKLISEYDAAAKKIQHDKNRSLYITRAIGLLALIFLILGYAGGLAEALSIFVKASPVVTSPRETQEKYASPSRPSR